MKVILINYEKCSSHFEFLNLSISHDYWLMNTLLSLVELKIEILFTIMHRGGSYNFLEMLT